MGLGWIGFVVVSLLGITGELATAVGVDLAGGDPVALVKLDCARGEYIDVTWLGWAGSGVLSLLGVTGKPAATVWEETVALVDGPTGGWENYYSCEKLHSQWNDRMVHKNQ